MLTIAIVLAQGRKCGNWYIFLAAEAVRLEGVVRSEFTDERDVLVVCSERNWEKLSCYFSHRRVSSEPVQGADQLSRRCW